MCRTLLCVGACWLAAAAQAAGPIVLFDAASIADESFNAAAHEGLLSLERHREVEVPSLAPGEPQAQARKNLRALMVRALGKGHDPIICVGWPRPAPGIDVAARFAAQNSWSQLPALSTRDSSGRRTMCKIWS